MMTPTASPLLKTFTISTNSQPGALLTDWTHEAGMPTDQGYLSGDKGRLGASRCARP
jgi:hypothetical protein